MLSFILPALVSEEGLFVLIEPMSKLQENIVERLREMFINTYA